MIVARPRAKVHSPLAARALAATHLPPVITEATRNSNREWAMERIRRGIAAPGEGPDVFPIVADYNDVGRYRRLADVLGRRGWSTSRLEKFFGGNFLRVYRDAWGA